MVRVVEIVFETLILRKVTKCQRHMVKACYE